MDMKSFGGGNFSGSSRRSKSRRRCLAATACACAAVVLQSVAAEPATADTQPELAATHHQSALEQRVTLLAAELNLDAQQQTQVRRILEEQRAQVLRVWNDASLGAANRVSATRTISDRTADRIRAILTEEQKAKYSKARKPRDTGENSTSSSVEEWMKAAAAKSK